MAMGFWNTAGRIGTGIATGGLSEAYRLAKPKGVTTQTTQEASGALGGQAVDDRIAAASNLAGQQTNLRQMGQPTQVGQVANVSAPNLGFAPQAAGATVQQAPQVTAQQVSAPTATAAMGQAAQVGQVAPMQAVQANVAQVAPIERAASIGLGGPNLARTANAGFASLADAARVSPAALATAQNFGGANVATAQDAAMRAAQMGNVSQLQQMAAGGGPSAAMDILKQATDRGIAQQFALARSMGGAPGLANRQAAFAVADLQQQAARDATILRAQEQQQSIGQLTGALAGVRGQEQNIAGLQANLLQQAGLQNASLGTQTSQFNAGSMNQAAQLAAQFQQQANLANQGARNQFSLTNAGFEQQANLANAAAQQQFQLEGTRMANQNLQFNAGAANQAALAQAGFQQQSNLANQQAFMQSGLANMDTQRQIAIQNALLQQQQGLANQQATNQFGLANQDAMLRALMANQATGLSADQGNQQIFAQQAGLQAQLQQALALQNAQFMQNQQFKGADLSMQAGLANQNTELQRILQQGGFDQQTALANLQAQIQNDQFNAGLRQDQFNNMLNFRGQNLNFATGQQQVALQNAGMQNQFNSALIGGGAAFLGGLVPGPKAG